MTYVYAKTLLIGDAAHPGSTFASGGTQAIEDAGAIFGLFSEIRSAASLPHWLDLFEKVRLTRSSRVHTGGRIPWGKYQVPWEAKIEELRKKDCVPDGLGTKEKKLEWESR